MPPASARAIGGGLRGLNVQAVQETGIVDLPRTHIGLLFHVKQRGILARRQNHGRDGQVIFACEVEIPLVMRRTTEDGPRTVVHQDEVGDPHGQLLFVIKRMDDFQAGVPAELLGGFDLRLGRPALADRLDEGRDGGIASGQPGGERVVGRHRQEARAEQGVGAGGVDDDAIRIAAVGEPEGQT